MMSAKIGRYVFRLSNAYKMMAYKITRVRVSGVRRSVRPSVRLSVFGQDCVHNFRPIFNVRIQLKRTFFKKNNEK